MSGVLIGRELARRIKRMVERENAKNATRPNSSKKRRYPRTDSGGTARLVELDMTKPAYETVSGATITTYMPSGTGTVYSRDESTGELTLGTDTVNIVNAAPRIYDPDTSRGRVVLAVPVQGGGYVPIPMATDPFVPAVHARWLRDSAHELALPGTWGSTAFDDLDDGSGDWTFSPGIGVSTPADSEQHWPPWSRPQNDRIYLTTPGLYLVLFSTDVYWMERSTSTAYQQTITTTSAGATPHTHDVDVTWRPHVIVRTEMRKGTGSSFNHITSNISGAEFVSPEFGAGGGSLMGTIHGATVLQVLESTSIDERYTFPRCTVLGKLYDTGTPPSMSFTCSATVLPLTKDNYASSSDTDAEWKHDPWASGSYQWWGTGTEPS